MKKIRTAVFPVAGLGSRFLPATKANAKEMLPVVDRPLIQYAVEEAYQAGIRQMVFITSATKMSIEEHFDRNYDLEADLASRGKDKLVKILQDLLPDDMSCIFIRQGKALGLGHAVGCARPVVGDEPFAVILPDDMINNDEGAGALAQMVQRYEETGSSVLGVERVPMEEVYKYGVVDADEVSDGFWKVKSIVEKPPVEEAPSNISVVGRYVLTPAIFDLIDNLDTGAGGEYQLTDAIAELINNEDVFVLEFDGKRYDCGSKMGHLQANVEMAMRSPELGEKFKAYLKTLDV